jgi:hypothetical protein
VGFHYTQQHHNEELTFRRRTDNTLHTIQEQQEFQQGMLQNHGEMLAQIQQEQQHENDNLAALLAHWNI